MPQSNVAAYGKQRERDNGLCSQEAYMEWVEI